jgi:site-specific DNA-methyltransferase (adenine-specific)
VAQNVLAHGTGAINVDACRVPHGGDGSWGNGRSDGSCWSPGRTNGGSEPEGARHDAGRWPANVLHDGSDEVEAAFAAFGSSTSTAQPRHNDTANKNGASMNSGSPNGTVTYGHADIGSASRFFYSAKATAADRAGSRHPTVKPVELMRWLVRLVCPPGGTCLDPFAGSGTTGEAAMLCGFDAVLIEQDTQHVADIRHRMHRWAGEDMPLFASPPPASDDAYDRDMRDLFAEAAP